MRGAARIDPGAQLQQMMSFFKSGHQQAESFQSPGRLRLEQRPAPRRALNFSAVPLRDPLAIDESSFTQY